MNTPTPPRETATREQRRAELEQTSFATNQQGGALMQPSNGRELMDMANMMAGSGQMVRDFYRGNAGDCAALIMICQPYGFNPFMVSWKTYKASKNADAPISFEGQLINAMVNQSAPVRGRLKYKYDGEGQTRTCTVVGVDKETGEEITYTSPQLGQIPIKNSPLWKSDPDQQLGYFSARSWARRHFPELLLGVYARDEIEEAPMRDVTPKQGGFAARKEAQAVEQAEPTKDEPETVSEAEIVPEDDMRDLTAELEYAEGKAGFANGDDAEDCPYDAGTFEETCWKEGWHAAASEGAA